MADVATMDIVIGADVQKAIAGLEGLSQELADLSKTGVTSIEQLNRAIATLREASAKTTDLGALAKYNVAIEKLTGEVTRLKNISDPFAKLSQGAGQATNAMTNLGRVVQDAPYGFIGIANNINPLLESFQRLQKETGSFGGALKALGKDFIGGGGIGFAVSLVTSLIVTFGDKLFSTSKKADEAKKANEDFAKSLDDVKSSAISTGVQLQGFINIARDTTKPLSERNEALREANKLMGEHGEKITLANVATKAITDQTNLFTKALIDQAVAAKYADRIADLIIKQTEDIKNYTKATDEKNRAIKDANDLNKIANTGTGGIGGGGNIAATQHAIDATKKATEVANIYKADTKTLGETMGEYAKVSERATASLGGLGIKTKEVAEKQHKVNEELDIYLDWRKKFEALRGTGFTIADLFDKIDTARIADAATKTNEYSKALADVIKLQKEQTKAAKDGKEAFDAWMESPFFAMGDITNDKVKKNLKDSEEQQKKHLENVMKAGQALESIFSDVFNSIASGGENAIKTLIHAIEQLIIKLASAAAAAALISIFTGGAANAAHGGLSFLGAFKGLLGFQHGGIIMGPTMAMVGERGPEVIFPLDKLRDYLSPLSASGVVVLETRVRGNDIWLSQARTNGRRGRTY